MYANIAVCYLNIYYEKGTLIAALIKKTIGHKCYFGIIAYNYYLCLSNIVRCNVSFLYLLYLFYINKHFTANIQTV